LTCTQPRPKGIDVYFENVGGAVWQAVLPLLNKFARVPVSGLIAHYNATGADDGTNLLPVTMRDPDEFGEPSCPPRHNSESLSWMITKTSR
jgi:NADPH-dependent curcumin reductase CurA